MQATYDYDLVMIALQLDRLRSWYYIPIEYALFVSLPGQRPFDRVLRVSICPATPLRLGYVSCSTESSSLILGGKRTRPPKWHQTHDTT